MPTLLRQKTWLEYAIALISGALMTLAFAPFDLSWLVFLGPTALLILISKQPQARQWRSAWFFGMGWFGAGISWVHVSIDQFGGLPLPVSILLMLLLCGYLALYPALAIRLLTRMVNPALWPLALPPLWFIAEWVRSWMLTGFPWLSLGYSQTTTAIGAWAPIVGETGISMLIMLICSSLAALVYCPIYRWRYATVIAITAGLTFGVQVYSPAQADSERVKLALVQGNIEQSLKWQPELEEPTRQLYRSLSEPYSDADIIIWPEAAVPSIEPLTVDFLEQLDRSMAENDTALITGIIDYRFENKEFYNALLVLGQKYDDQGQGHYFYRHSNRYQKHHLLPIGEFVPFQSLLKHVAPLFNLPMSSFSRGEFSQDNLTAKGYRVAPAMCYEIVFPRQLRANIYPDTDFILTVSNDAWFGDSHGPHQHMQMAQMRAREFAKPVVRATNNGVTAIVDHTGKITQQVPQFQETVLTGDITLTTSHSIYLKYGEFINWIVVLLALFLTASLQGWRPAAQPH